MLRDSVPIEALSRGVMLRYVANAKRILGVDVDKSIYDKWLFMRGLDEGYSYVDSVQVCLEQSLAHCSSSGSRIFCSFHYGLYKTLVFVLAKKYSPLCIPVTKDVYTNRDTLFSKGFEGLGKHVPIFVDIETRFGLGKLLSLYRSGATLLFFADGNSSSKGMGGDSRHSIVQQFLSTNLTVHQGIPWIANHFGEQVTILLPMYQWKSNLVDVEAIIPPSAETTQIWSYLEEQIKRDFIPWEGWQYVNLFEKVHPFRVDTSETVNSCSLYVLNSDEWDVYTVGEERYLMDMSTVQSISVSSALFNRIVLHSKCSYPLSYSELLRLYGSESLILDLIQKSIIVPNTLDL